MNDISKHMAELYEQFEKKKTEVKQGQDTVKELREQMMEKVKESGLNSVVVPGLETDYVEIYVDINEREVLNKKLIAETLGLKVKDLAKIEDWVRLTKEGEITPEIIEDAKETEEREQLKVENYSNEKEDE